MGTARSGAVEINTNSGKSSLAGFVIALNLCSNGSTILYAAYAGSNYQWQVNKGDGFVNLSNTINYSGTTSALLGLQTIPGEWNGYEYRCMIDGKATGSTRLNITNDWKGLISGSWENPQNWSCGILPDSTTDITIPEKANVVLNSNVKVKSLFLDSSSVLSINTGKKLEVTGASNIIKISKAGLDSVNYLLYGNTPGLLLMPGENFSYIIKKSSKDITDSIPSNISFKSANTIVASITSAGLITALNEGETMITATDVNGNTALLYMTVKATGLPSLSTPLFALFSKPFYIINGDTGEKISVSILNRKGGSITGAAKIILKNSVGEQPFDLGQIIKLKESGYSARVTVNDSLLLGEAIVFSFNMNGSKIIDDQTVQRNTVVAMKTTAFTTPPKGLPFVYYVLLDNRTVPEYFNRPGLTSKTIQGDVFYLTVAKLYNGVIWTGFYELTTNIVKEEINVESKIGDVITGGKQLTSVGTGYENWRVNHLNYISSWNESTVFYDFSGDWICKNDLYGHSVKMRVPAVQDFIYYSPQLATPYKSFSIPITPGFAQFENATAEYTDLANPSNVDKGSVQIGPVDWCGCLDGQARALLPGNAAGGMILNYYNRYGDITYVDKNEFHYKSRIGADPIVPYYGPDAVYIRKMFGFTPSISLFLPTSGQQGTSISIRGRSLLGTSSVLFGSVPAASFIVVNDSVITAIVGSGGSGSISVSTAGGTAFLNGFTYVSPPPLISFFTPASQEVGMIVTIGGSNFTGTTEVKIGGVSATVFTVTSDNTITVEIPPGAISGNITVVTPSGEASKSGFGFIPFPTYTFTINNGNGDIELLGGRLYKQNYYQDVWSLETQIYSDTIVKFNGPAGEILPVVDATYNFSQLAITYSQIEGFTKVYYGNPESGTIKFTIVNSRCVGTITNYKVFEKLFIGYSTTKSITINGTFNVPVY